MAGCDINQYTLDGSSVDELGLLDKYRKLITKTVYGLVRQGKWFAFCTKAGTEQVDIMGIENNKGEKMGRLIGDVFFPDTEYRPAVYKHFLRAYMCYYESPIIKASKGTEPVKNGYEKFIATSNIGVISAWLDIPLEEAYNLYYPQLDSAYLDDGDVYFPYVRLYITKDGVRKIRKPREMMDLSKRGLRISPVFALKMGVDMLNNMWSKEVVRVTFKKDGGDTRVLDTSTNVNIIRNIYGESDYLFRSMNEMYEGDILKDSTFQYGYLRLPEIGGSRYDTPLRSLSFSRILSIEYDVKPNLFFIDIDIDNVLDSFKKYVERASNKKLSEVLGSLMFFHLITGDDKKKIQSTLDLENWADMKYLSLGTQFLRDLCMFMLGNPQYFPGYTGQLEEDVDDIKNSSSGLVEDEVL